MALAVQLPAGLLTVGDSEESGVDIREWMPTPLLLPGPLPTPNMQPLRSSVPGVAGSLRAV